MFASKIFFAVLLSLAFVSTIGCGGTSSPDCGPIGLNVAPPSATVDHAAVAPGNSQTFTASFKFNNVGCPAVTAALVNSNWTVSDPSVHLSASQAAQVTATCTAAVASPVTITATPVSGEMFTGMASLTCQ